MSNPGPQAAQLGPGLTGGVWLHLLVTLGEKGHRGIVGGREKALAWERFMVFYYIGYSQEDRTKPRSLKFMQLHIRQLYTKHWGADGLVRKTDSPTTFS